MSRFTLAGYLLLVSCTHGANQPAKPSSPGPSSVQSAGSESTTPSRKHLVIEDFESAMPGTSPDGWTTLPGWGPGNIAVANDEFHSGKQSLKSESASPGQPRLRRNLYDLEGTATKHWGRVFYKVKTPAPKAENLYLHVTFAALRGADEARVVDTVQDPAGKHQFLYNVPDDSCCASSPYDYAFDDAWHCAEWHLDVASKSYSFFIDGREVPSLTFSGKEGSKMSNFDGIALGQIFYQNPPGPFTSWLDDFAIGDERIGCN